MPRLPANDAETGQLTLFSTWDMISKGDGTYSMVPRKGPPSVTASITVAARSSGLSRKQIYRLYKTGFVRGDNSSPGKILIDMVSLAEHKKASSDPEFWTDARRLQYRAG